MNRPEPFDYRDPAYAEFADELALWSAPFLMMLLDRVPVRRGRTIVDVGAGAGCAALELAQRCGAGTRVIAVDPWAEAMGRLKRKAAFYGVDNIEPVVAPMEEAGLPDGVADLVVSNLGLNNFADPPATLAACRRVLRPGGELVMSTNLVGHMAELYTVLRTVLERCGHGDRLPALAAHIAHRGTVASGTALLQDAGFVGIGVAEDSFRWRFADGRALLRHFFIRVGFLASWLELVPEAVRLDLLRRLETDLDELAAEHGELSLTIPMACFVARVGGP